MAQIRRATLGLAALATAFGAQVPGSVVSAGPTLRVAAECGARRTLIPTTAPKGYRYAAWQVFAHNVDCDVGFAIRFRRDGARVTWEAGGPQTFRLTCSGAAIARVSGLSIFHRVRGGLEKVWACMGSLRIVAFQRMRAGRTSVRELVRMVASARRTSLDRAPGSRYALASSAELAQMSARYGSPLFVPRALPPGFVFSRWAYRARDPNLDGRTSLLLTFGRSGRVLEWGVYRGIDKLGLDCPMPATRRFRSFAVIDGVSVYLRVGIHGGTVWRCIRADPKPVEVALWYSIQLDSPPMRRMLGALVASARTLG